MKEGYNKTNNKSTRLLRGNGYQARPRAHYKMSLGYVCVCVWDSVRACVRVCLGGLSTYLALMTSGVTGGGVPPGWPTRLASAVRRASGRPCMPKMALVAAATLSGSE